MMNHYVSTYKKDYTWPHKDIQPSIQPAIQVKACTCPDSRVLKKLVDVSLGESFDWSRIGPMGRLLEPKVYHAKIQLIPLIKCTDVDETVKKPFLGEINAQVEADRMKTTYQIDYSDPAYARMVQKRDKPSTVDDMDCEKLRCMPIKIILENDCPSQCHLPSLKYNGNSNQKQEDFKRRNGLKYEKKRKDIQERQISPWKSEYQDSISRIGQVIMKTKLHDKKKRTVPVLATSY